MIRTFVSILLAVVLTVFVVAAQTNTPPEEPIRFGPGVTAPRLLYKIEPEFSSEARSANMQGTVVLQLVINEQGRPTDITVMSPLGFGLDERAVSAVEKWLFAPGVKNGAPVKILATVEVSFRFLGTPFDETGERRRTSFNIAVQTINKGQATAKGTERAVQTILELSQHKFTPAMYVAGLWMTKGEHVPQNVPDGLALIQKAAAKNYGPALYEIGSRRVRGLDLPQDVEKGLDDMQGGCFRQCAGAVQSRRALCKRRRRAA